MKTAWMWRAWNLDRSRICDCGLAFADSADGAISIALMSLGGPHRADVTSIHLQEVKQDGPASRSAYDIKTGALTHL